MQMTFRWYGEGYDRIKLSDIKQIPGVKGIVWALHNKMPGEVWKEEEIAEVKRQCDKYGFNIDVVESVNVHDDIKIGLPTRDKYIENYKQTIRNLSKYGVKVICYNFMPIFDWTRSNLFHEVGDGSTALFYSLICVLDEEVGKAFLRAIQEFSLTKITEKNAPSVVYSPLHGTGRKYVQEILKEIGVNELYTVAEQEMPDGNFTTCPYPNPEEKAALTLALRDAEKYKPDLVMATDPDADRIGIAVPDKKGEYVLLNSNETGSILLYYVLLKKIEMGIPCTSSTVIKTIVTTDIIFDMAKEYGAEVKEVLTEFKYIGEALEETEDYLLGLEESYGYLVGTHARDKDAVSAAMMLAESCAYFKENGKSLYAVLQEIYEKYGYYQTELKSISLPGKDGMEKMQEVLANIRKNPPTELDGKTLTFDDFAQGLFGLA